MHCLLIERHHEKDKTVHPAFLDLEKVIDRISRNLIWQLALVSWCPRGLHPLGEDVLPPHHQRRPLHRRHVATLRYLHWCPPGICPLAPALITCMDPMMANKIQ